MLNHLKVSTRGSEYEGVKAGKKSSETFDPP